MKAFLEEVTACESQSVKEIPGRRSHVVEIRGEKEPTYLLKGVKRQSGRSGWNGIQAEVDKLVLERRTG